jgi:gluconokinase
MLFDRTARPVEGVLAQVACHLDTTADGGAVFEAAELLSGVTEVIDDLLQQTGALAEKIEGVAIDTFVTNIMGLDEAGDPVTPVFTYADTRNAAAAEALRQAFDLTRVHDRTGCRIHTSYLPARFRWLADSRPELLEKARYWVSIGEYLFDLFLGQRVVSYSVASWTGLLNRHTLSWDEAWLAHLPIDEGQLSPLTDVHEPVAGLKKEWSERWPALKEVPWFPAIGDGAAANIGSGCDTSRRVALTVGSTGAMRAVLDQNIPEAPTELWVYRVDAHRALLGGATTEGGNLFAWLKDTLQLPSGEELENDLAQLPPAGHGLTMLPFVAGERAPGWRGDARASLIGLTLNTGPIEIVRAGLESIAYRFALIHRAIAPNLPSDHQIIVSGGILNSPTWLQIMADVLNQPVIASAEKEATSRGAALLALETLAPDTERPDALADTYQPDSEAHARYAEGLDKQVALYDKLVAA